MERRLPTDQERTPTVGYGSGGTWLGMDITAMVADVLEGFCPGCKLPLQVETLLTYNHRDAEQWGCCHCCARAWRMEQPTGLKATACIQHTNWDCTHPLPGATWTPVAHAAAWPGVRHMSMLGPAAGLDRSVVDQPLYHELVGDGRQDMAGLTGIQKLPPK